MYDRTIAINAAIIVTQNALPVAGEATMAATAAAELT